jgi:hypothetical protein
VLARPSKLGHHKYQIQSMVDMISEVAAKSGNIKVLSGPSGTTSIIMEILMIAYMKKSQRMVT